MPRNLQQPDLPSVKISARGAARLKGGHVWVYRSDVVSADGVDAGALVNVTDQRGKPLGTALYSNSSQIAIRVISRGPVVDLAVLVRERISAAIAFRESTVSGSNACRLVFSEADFLPGLIIDRFNDIISLQLLTQAMDSSVVREAVLAELAERFPDVSIFERVDSHIRELEHLPARQSQLLRGHKSSTVVSINGVQFHFEAAEGQKTGSFLDQRENYAAAAGYARGEALDVFCYQGGFALHLAPRCSQVTAVDSSLPALEVAERNATLNNREIEWIEANAFDLLKDYSATRHYDTIILDPPAFAKSRRELDAAIRGYKEINLRALKMLRPGGVLVTCSCSYHVNQANFLEMLASAAADTHRQVRILEVRGAAKDHPVLLNVPESAYLKCAVLSVNN